MAYSFLSQSIRAQDLILWIDLRRFNANFLDLSSYGNDVAVISNAFWSGGGMQFTPDDGYLRVTNSASLQDATILSCMVVGHFNNTERTAASESVLISKDDALGGIEWQFGLDNTPRLTLTDSMGTVTCAATWGGARSLGFTIASFGNTPIGYMNGLSLGNFSGSIDLLVPPDGNLFLGNRGDVGRSMRNPGQAWCLWNRQLDATEMSIAHGELMSLAGGEH
jgi:hypothetical protein